MKLDSNQTLQFLRLLEKYPVLWNTKDESYTNRLLKDEQLVLLYEECRSVGLSFTSVEYARKKIKNVRDTFKREWTKVHSSKVMGCASDEVYTPSLFWYKEAQFLLHSLPGQSSLNLELNDVCLSEPTANPQDPDGILDPSELIKVAQPTPRGSLSQLLTRRGAKRKAPAQPSPAVKPAVVNGVNGAADGSSRPHPFEMYGEYVAGQLLSLPPRQALILQGKINKLITQHMLRNTPKTGTAVTTNGKIGIAPSVLAESTYYEESEVYSDSE